MIDPKKAAAEKAVSFIKERSVVGIGDGSTMAYLAQVLNEQIKNGFHVTLLTSSSTTQELLFTYGIDVKPIRDFSNIDIYFDGCDQFDYEFNALKSGSGIHTKEKMVAQMAREFVLVGEEKKRVEKFDPTVPLVIELLPETVNLISSKIEEKWPDAKYELRVNKTTGETLKTGHNNLLLEVRFTSWPVAKEVDDFFRKLTGVVAISLFYQMATGAIVAGEKGVQVLSKANI